MSSLNKAFQTREFEYMDDGFDAPSQSSDGIIETVLDFFLNVILRIVHFLETIFPIVGVGVFLYVILRILTIAKGKGWQDAGEALVYDTKHILKFFGKLLSSIGKGIRGFFQFFAKRKWLSGGIIMLVVLFFIFSVVNSRVKIVKLLQVSAGQVAVDVASGRVLEPGTHVVSPLRSDFILSHIAKYGFDIPQITADSKELQDVVLHVNLTFHLDREKLIEFYTREGVMSIWDISNSLVTPRAVEEIKNIINDYSFKEIHSQQRTLKDQFVEEISDRLEPLGIVLDDVNIVNIRISPEFVDVLGELEIVTESLEVSERKLEEEKNLSNIELEKAEREKLKKIKEAEGIAESNRIINEQNITPQMLELKRLENERIRIEQWNGALPNTVGGNIEF